MDRLREEQDLAAPFVFPAGPRQALLIHGFLGTPREMRPLASALAEQNVTASGLLLPGFGSDLPRLRHIRAEDWLEATRREWKRVRQSSDYAALIGFSMGGAVALAVAADPALAPDHLILIAPHWRFADARARLLPVAKHVMREFRPFSARDFEKPEVRKMFGALAPDADLDDPAVRQELIRQATIPTGALDQLRRIGNFAAGSATSLHMPTTIVQGLQDATSLPDYSRDLARRTGAELVEVTGGHMIVDPDQPTWPLVRDVILSRVVQ
ncbi:MAG: alpha/beta fold hydrolase [Thermomicrobiales bacterium]